MTTQEKTAAIQSIVANHQDNQAALKAANVNPALDMEMTTAMTNAMKSALEKVFAPPASARPLGLGAARPQGKRGGGKSGG